MLDFPWHTVAFLTGISVTPTIENDVVTWRLPLGNGLVQHVALDDCGHYVRWLFDNPSRSNGMDLEVAIAPIPYAELAAAFTRVTGHPAQYIDISLEEYWSDGPFAVAAKLPAGYNAGPDSMSSESNFSGFFNTWKYDILTRDFKLLDEIHPGRIRSADDFFRREEEKHGKGSLWKRVQVDGLGHILKISEDGRKGKL